MISRLAGSSSTHGLHFDVPYDIQPRHNREIFKPDLPRFT
jgi:hypothetical protein